MPEIANPGFASNTTLAGNSDIYVANRGNDTILRLRQDGTVVAVRRVALPGGQVLGGGRLNGIAVSSDAQKIWVTVSGAIPDYPKAPGVLLELPAFGPATQRRWTGDAPPPTVEDLIAQGRKIFATEFTPAEGLGPLFNRALMSRVPPDAHDRRHGQGRPRRRQPRRQIRRRKI